MIEKVGPLWPLQLAEEFPQCQHRYIDVAHGMAHIYRALRFCADGGSLIPRREL